MNYSCIYYLEPSSTSLDESIQALLSQHEEKLSEVLIACNKQDEALAKKMQTKLESIDQVKLVIGTNDRCGLLKKAMNLAKGDFMFFCDSETIWERAHIKSFVPYCTETELDLLIADPHDLYRSRDKQAIIEGKADQVFAKNTSIHISSCALRNRDGIITAINKKIKASPFEAYFSALFSIQYSDKVGFVDGLNTSGIYPKPIKVQTRSRSEFITERESFLSDILHIEESAFLRRAHYFYFVRSTLDNQSFLRKFVSINTLFLEGDYKRFTDAPIKEAFRDLRS